MVEARWTTSHFLSVCLSHCTHTHARTHTHTHTRIRTHMYTWAVTPSHIPSGRRVMGLFL